MKNEQDEKLIQLLQTEWNLLNASVTTLKLSVDKCQAIGVKREYTFEEQESVDSLTSKFSRSSDLFTQKIIRTVWMLLHEGFVPFIDMMNAAEKIKLIKNANVMISIRDLRNQIAHEYIPEVVFDLLPEIMDSVQQLIENIHSCNRFIGDRKWI
jgi:hypothetical protein